MRRFKHLNASTRTINARRTEFTNKDIEYPQAIYQIISTKYTLAFFLVSTFFFLIELIYGIDLVVETYNIHSAILNEALPAIPLVAIGVLIDYLTMREKREIETRKAIYRETMSGAYHLLGNLQNALQVVNLSESVKEELGSDLMNEIDKSSKEVQEIMTKLGKLESPTPEEIKAIATSNVRNQS